ncbi:MAG: NAD(P)H-hydrate dehydratase [Promethearchaeota archaeon]
MVKIPVEPVAAKDISRFDENCAGLGIPKILLMECAGMQATNKIIEKYNLKEDEFVVIFAGTGNNGGDGFTIARHLASHGIYVHIILLGDPIHIRSEEAKKNWQIVNTLDLHITISVVKESTQFIEIAPFCQAASVLIDAILGTGVKGKIREPISCAVNLINMSSKPKISIDVPTGVDPNTGKIFDKAVKCDFLITFHREKKGLLGLCDTWVAPIGVPEEAHLFVGRGDLLQALPKRKRDTHKGQNGKLLVIGGSSAYSGAPAFTALTGIEFGLDLVICMVPENIANTVRSYSPNLIVRAGKSENFGIEDLPLAQDLVQWADAVVIGPGMGLDPSVEAFFSAILSFILRENKPTVIDADGIKHLGKILSTSSIDLHGKPIIITPHINELQHLIDISEYNSKEDLLVRSAYFEKVLRPLGGVFLIKGVEDIIISESTDNCLCSRINRTGCPEMSVGGTGDVLAGLVGSFLAVRSNPYISACVGAYLNGLLGESAVELFGPRIKATDLITRIRPILKNF